MMSPKLRAELDDVLTRPKVARRLDPEGLEQLRGAIAAAPVTTDPPAVGDGDLTVLVDVVPPVRTPAAFLEDLSTW